MHELIQEALIITIFYKELEMDTRWWFSKVRTGFLVLTAALFISLPAFAQEGSGNDFGSRDKFGEPIGINVASNLITIAELNVDDTVLKNNESIMQLLKKALEDLGPAVGPGNIDFESDIFMSSMPYGMPVLEPRVIDYLKAKMAEGDN